MPLVQPVRTALIGLGYWGPNLLRVFSAQAGCVLARACDKDAARIETQRRRYPAVEFGTDAEEIFADASIELVLIATPTSTHFALAKKALEAGKHVFIEKPMASSVAEAEELCALARKHKKLLFVDHTFAFAAPVVALRSMVERGELGDLLCFDSVRVNLGLIQRDANVLQDLAVHDLAILSAVAPLSTVTSVTAIGHRHFGEQMEEAHVHLAFPTAFHAHIHVSWLSPVKLRNTTVTGTKAMVTFDDVQPSEKLRVYDRGVEHDKTKADPSVAAHGAKADPFFPKYRAGDIRIPALPNTETLAVEAEHVLACVRGLETPRVSGDDGLVVMRILEAANASMASGSPVKIVRDGVKVGKAPRISRISSSTVSQ